MEMAKEARARELDALGMYNLTLQAGSWDGSGYGLKVGLVQAMIVSFGCIKDFIRKILADQGCLDHQLAVEA